MRYDYIHEFMLTQPDAEYRGVISRMTYARQTRYKPNWIWQKRGGENVVGKKQPNVKGKKVGVKKLDIPQPATQAQEQAPTQSQAQTQEFDIIMDSTDILEQPGVSAIEEVKHPKGKKPRSKKKTADIPVDVAVVDKEKVPDTTNVLESAQEFDIVLEQPSTPDSKNVVDEPIASEYKQISIKLTKTKKQPKEQPILGEGDEEVGLIEPIKPKRVYKKKTAQIQEQGQGVVEP
jgi:hypothetical protein